MRRHSTPSTWLIVAAAGGFLAGMLVMAALFAIFPVRSAAIGEPSVDAHFSAPAVTILPTPRETPPPVVPPPPPREPLIAADPLEDLRARHLTLPVYGARKEDLHDSFDELRGKTRRHEAIDMLAARHTPVVAVEDGTIARLFNSEAGGITVYQFDPGATYVYYYAHLERYASGLDEGDTVQRGQTIGYVGTSGNAPRSTPHLHFAIFRMTDKKQWWQGTAIDPYSVLK